MSGYLFNWFFDYYVLTFKDFSFSLRLGFLACFWFSLVWKNLCIYFQFIIRLCWWSQFFLSRIRIQIRLSSCVLFGNGDCSSWWSIFTHMTERKEELVGSKSVIVKNWNLITLISSMHAIFICWNTTWLLPLISIRSHINWKLESYILSIFLLNSSLKEIFISFTLYSVLLSFPFIPTCFQLSLMPPAISPHNFISSFYAIFISLLTDSV